jgi:poly-beta-1,6 N-acetyl-D-glucosamine synthase
VRALDAIVAIVLCATLARGALMVVMALVHRVRSRAPRAATGLVSVLVPAHDEEAVIAGTIRSIAASEHTAIEVIVVDDGSRDRTRAVAEGIAAEDPRVRVLALSPNAGKAHALDCGLRAARGDVVVTVDADTVLAPDAIGRLAAWFADPAVDAVAANVKVGNRASLIGVWQSIEYVGGLNIDRRAQATLGCITTVPGAAGAFRRSALDAIGGFPADTLTEDTDVTIALLTAGRTVRYDDRAIAWTEAPSTLGGLFRQRTRWHRGNLQCAWKHRGAFVHGPWRVRLFALPNLWFSHLGVYLLPILSGVWLALRGGDALAWSSFAAIIAGLFALDLGVAALAYAIDAERGRELVQVPFQRVAWPFLLWAVFATVLARIARGARSEWVSPRRTGSVARPWVSRARAGR